MSDVLGERAASQGKTTQDGSAGNGRLVAAILAIGVYTSLFSNSTVTSALSAGQHPDIRLSAVSGWQYAREGATLLALLFTAVLVIRRRDLPTWRIPVALFIFLMYIVGQTFRVLLFGENPVQSAAAGLRPTYTLLLALLLSLLGVRDLRRIFHTLTRWLIPFVAIQLVIVAGQLLSAPPIFGTTFAGPRPWGTFSSPNNLALCMVGILVMARLINSQHVRLFILICLPVVAVSGSRTALLASFIVLAGETLGRIRLRWALVPWAGVALYGLYLLVTSSALSGRVINEEGRLDAWGNSLALLDSPWDVLFGAGLGTGTNAIVVLSGRYQTEGTAISDSAFTMTVVSTGFIGLAFLVLGAVLLFARSSPILRYSILPALVLCGASFNLPEIAPLNLAAGMVVAWVLSSDRERWHDEVTVN